MRHDTSKKIFTYWNNLRGNRIAPDRREIEPSDIRELLGDTFVLEIDKRYRTIAFRLAGTRLCNAYCRELKGVGFLGLWDEIDNLSIFEAVKEVYDNGRPATLSLVAETEDKKFLEYEMLLLPLQNRGSSALRILGTASPSQPESWLGVVPVINNRLKSVRYLDLENLDETPPLSPTLPDNQEMPAYSVANGVKPRQVAHLTVFEGGIRD